MMFFKYILATLLVLSGGVAYASGASEALPILHATTEPLAIAALVLFVFAYIAVMAEESLHLRKSKPVILAAGVIWVLVALLAQQKGMTAQMEASLNHNLIEYAQLFLFLLVAMTYINALEERHVFESLRSWLVVREFSYRKLFWVTGFIAFFLSPVADNLTTALILGAVILAVGANDVKFVTMAMINVVVAANAGGAFSPFGDITTLMVWQSGHVEFTEFFDLFIPSLLNFVVPAACMYPFLPKGTPHGEGGIVPIKRGGLTIALLFGATIATAVSFENVLHLPPYLGMMSGMALLMFFAFYLRKTGSVEDDIQFDIFRRVARAEWDTLLFFFGVIFCVGGLSFIGYLELMSKAMYTDLGPTTANVLVGIISAVVDNIPVMFAVLSMGPEMSHPQWLLITLTAGVGGSLLSIGSAAGVGLMGVSKGRYTFFGHLKWTWAIALGYAVSIISHIALNGS